MNYSMWFRDNGFAVIFKSIVGLVDVWQLFEIRFFALPALQKQTPFTLSKFDMSVKQKVSPTTKAIWFVYQNGVCVKHKQIKLLDLIKNLI